MMVDTHMTHVHTYANALCCIAWYVKHVLEAYRIAKRWLSNSSSEVRATVVLMFVRMRVSLHLLLCTV